MTEPAEAAEVPANGPETDVDEPNTFSREYVHELREEAKTHREALAESNSRGDAYFEMLKLRTLEAAASGVLQATSDMPRDDPRYYDNHGFPSLEGMREVAEEIAASKPYLSKVRGDVRQGYQPETNDKTAHSILGDAIRGAL